VPSELRISATPYPSMRQKWEEKCRVSQTTGYQDKLTVGKKPNVGGNRIKSIIITDIFSIYLPCRYLFFVWNFTLNALQTKLQNFSVAAPKISSIFQGKFPENFGPKDWIFQKFFHNIQNFGKCCNFKMLTKIKISESKVCVISQGNSSGRMRINCESSKFHQNRNTSPYCVNHHNNHP